MKPTTTIDGKEVNIRIFDNGGTSVDRYTVIFMDQPERQENTFVAVAMDEKPFHPQGFGQHTSAMPGNHLGKRITFEELPADCQKLVRNDLGEGNLEAKACH